MESKSLELAKQFLGKPIKVIIDRKLGDKHPKWGWTYPVNYGYVPGVIAPDGEELDAYVLNVSTPMTEFAGTVIAIVHRTDNDDDKLIVVPTNDTISDEDIEKLVDFQEQYFKHNITRLP